MGICFEPIMRTQFIQEGASCAKIIIEVYFLKVALNLEMVYNKINETINIQYETNISNNT